MNDRIASFEEFWPYYIREHSKPLTRWMHFVGTASAMATLAAFGRTRRPRYLVAALVAGYGPAWVSHFLVERNKPATFHYPLWSLIADLKMFHLMSSGKMDAEVARILASDGAPSGNGKSAGTEVSGFAATDRGSN